MRTKKLLLAPRGSQFQTRYSSYKPEQPFDGDLSLYRTAAIGYAAPGAQEVQIDEEIKNPLTINGWKSYWFVISDKQNRQSVRDGITFLNLDDKEQIVLRISANQKEFFEADRRAARIMNS